MTSITTLVTSEITSSLIPPLPWSFSSSFSSPSSSSSCSSIERPQVFTSTRVDIVSGVINYIVTTVNHVTNKIRTSESEVVTTAKATNYISSSSSSRIIINSNPNDKYCQYEPLNVNSSYTNDFFLSTLLFLLLSIVIVIKSTTIYTIHVCHFNLFIKCLLNKCQSQNQFKQISSFILPSKLNKSSVTSSTASTASFSSLKKGRKNLPTNLISFCKFNSIHYLLLGVFLTFSLGPNVIRSQSNYREIEKKILDEIIGEGRGYDNRIRPTGNKSLVTQPSNPKHQPADGPCMVRVNIYLRSISKISDLDMEYSVQITFREQWVDERLQYSDMDGQIRFLTLTDPSKIWKPDLFFSNEKEGHFHDIIMPNVLLRIYPHGEVLYSIRLSLVLACPMDLKYYPLDKQTCMIRMASYGYTTEDLVFLWKEGDPVQVTTNLHLPRFTLQRIQTNYCTSKTNTGEYSCLRVDLTFKREFSYYLIQIYIPCCMLVIVSWVSFWLDPNAIPARVSLGVTTLLTMATQISGINASLPPVSYTKAIDVWTGVCLTFVFGALLEFALVNYASRSDAHRAAALHHQFGLRRWDADGNITDDGMPPAGYQLKPLLAPARSDLMRGQQQTTVGGYLTTNSPIDSRNFIKRWLSKFPTRSKRIDVISRIFFPLMFAMFNLVYWVTYLFRDELNDL